MSRHTRDASADLAARPGVPGVDVPVDVRVDVPVDVDVDVDVAATTAPRLGALLQALESLAVLGAVILFGLAWAGLEAWADPVRPTLADSPTLETSLPGASVPGTWESEDSRVE